VYFCSFIIAADFWQERFPGRPVALDMSMTYIIVAFGTVLLNNILLSLTSFKLRVNFGKSSVMQTGIMRFSLMFFFFRI
jgi:hypothetical protein